MLNTQSIEAGYRIIQTYRHSIKLMCYLYVSPLQDKNVQKIKLSDLAQIGQTHGIKCLDIVIFDFQSYKLSLTLKI